MGGVSAASISSQLFSGPGSRQISYKQYDGMDSDIDISRSLDIIAEEMSGKNEKTNLPFDIQYQKEDNEDISDTTAITLRQALRQWSDIQDFHKRVFSIARCLIKYGDCFFRKTSDTKKWIYVDPSLVHGIEIDINGNIINYHIKKNVKQTLGINIRQEQLEILPSSAIIHFTMCDDMGDMAPFGASVLKPIHRVYKQLSMLEDAVIIYRIVRAPERRVFNIDVGNTPPHKVKAYLEEVKNSLRQKKTPGINSSGDSIVDGTADPSSLQEDYFFARTASGRGSEVTSIPGGAEEFGTTLLKYFNDKISRGLRIPTSYMQGTDGNGAQYNDGKVGIAYIEELRFAQFIRRIQDRIDIILDQEFKIYLRVVGLKIDDELFKIRLPDPANFALYRQAALDADLISAYNNVKDDKTLSSRFKQKRYLGLTDDDIQMNEVLIKEERDIQDTGKISALRQIYDPAVNENREVVTVDSEEPPSDDIGSSSGSSFFADTPTEEPSKEEPPIEAPAKEEPK